MSDGLDAGEFSTWLGEIQEALHGARAADVPCGECTACCTSSQFVPIAPDEQDTLDHIPAELLFPAPRLPAGHVVLGYDERGHCPMLVAGACSIYEHRPRTCRTYDCRVFAATGIELTDDDKALIAQRVRRWRFQYGSPGAREQHEAVSAAAAFVSAANPELPASATERAVLAVEIHDLFRGREPDPSDVWVAIRERRRAR